MSLAEFEPGSLIRRQVNQPWAHCASHNANDIDNADDIDNANDNDNNNNNKKKSLGSLSATCTNYLGNHRVVKCSFTVAQSWKTLLQSHNRVTWITLVLPSHCNRLDLLYYNYRKRQVNKMLSETTYFTNLQMMRSSQCMCMVAEVSNFTFDSQLFLCYLITNAFVCVNCDFCMRGLILFITFKCP